MRWDDTGAWHICAVWVGVGFDDDYKEFKNVNIEERKEIYKQGRADSQFEQRKFDAIDWLIHEVERLNANDDELKALLDWRMCSDPFPCVGMQVVDEFLNRLAVSAGFTDWIDAYHG